MQHVLYHDASARSSECASEYKAKPDSQLAHPNMFPQLAAQSRKLSYAKSPSIAKT